MRGADGLRRACSVSEILNKEYALAELTGVWQAAIGCPPLSGTWFIYGGTKQGKTTFSLMLAKYLSGFGRVFYNSIEEGDSPSIQAAYRRVKMDEAQGTVLLLKEDVEEMIVRLRRKKSPRIVFMDSVQFAQLTFAEYKRLKSLFPNKLFVYISHVKGTDPEGMTAIKIQRDAGVTFRVEGFRAYPTSRYGGGEYITICEELATRYYTMLNNKANENE